MTSTEGGGEHMLDAYLDGRLDSAQRESFEQLLASKPELRREVDLQRDVDGALRRLAKPPDVAALLARVRENTPMRIRPRRRLRSLLVVGGLGIAAALALFAIGSALWWWDDPASWPYGRLLVEPRSASEVYRYAEGHDFSPAWECENDQQFAAAVWNRLGTPLVLASSLPENIQPRGLLFANVISRDSAVMCALVDGRGVLVVIDRADRDGVVRVPPWSGLRVFEKKLGDLVLYEVTPWDKPAMLGWWRIPDVSDAWLQEGARQLEEVLTESP
ncbi:MAG: hypothetical protein D6744_02760 [Planctomycetota bacterium]|nr:MAG: hypothetical protein D6744_02760 [Planctomycetota bacterium]